MLTTIAVVAGLAIGAVARLRMREVAPSGPGTRGTTRPVPLRAPRPATPPRAVLLHLHAADGCCRDAQLLGERPLSAAFAPSLPLVGCGRLDCTCRYERVTDRRRAERRVAIDRRDAIRFQDGRRRRPDRRTPNRVWDEAD